MLIDLRNMGNETNAIDISSLASASYLLTIEGTSGTINKQIIKK